MFIPLFLHYKVSHQINHLSLVKKKKKRHRNMSYIICWLGFAKTWLYMYEKFLGGDEIVNYHCYLCMQTCCWTKVLDLCYIHKLGSCFGGQSCL